MNKIRWGQVVTSANQAQKRNRISMLAGVLTTSKEQKRLNAMVGQVHNRSLSDKMKKALELPELESLKRNKKP